MGKLSFSFKSEAGRQIYYSSGVANLHSLENFDGYHFNKLIWHYKCFSPFRHSIPYVLDLVFAYYPVMEFIRFPFRYGPICFYAYFFKNSLNFWMWKQIRCSFIGLFAFALKFRIEICSTVLFDKKYVLEIEIRIRFFEYVMYFFIFFYYSNSFIDIYKRIF